MVFFFFFFFQAEDGIRDLYVTGVQTCALPICDRAERQIEQRRRDPRIDPLVRLHVAVAEIEEGLPTDEAPRRACSSAQVNRIRLSLAGRIEDHPEEWVAVVAAQVRTVGRAHHAVSKPVRPGLKLDGVARNHQVLVVSRVRDDRRICPVVYPRQVLALAAEADPQLVVVGRVVELRARDRALPVDGVEVERRRPRVRRHGRIGRYSQTRSRIEGDVVVDELADERRPGGVRRVVRVVRAQARSVIKSTGPLLRSSFASRSPPGFPRSASAARTASVADANGGRFGKMRPNVVALVETVALRAATARGAIAALMPPDTATAPAPAPARFRKPRLLKRELVCPSSTVLIAAPSPPTASAGCLSLQP